MMLLFDAGNTRIKWMLAAPGAPLGSALASGAVVHADAARLAHDISDALIALAPTEPALNMIVAANVAGAGARAAIETAVAAIGAHAVPIAWFASLPQLAGVTNGYRNPGQLGCDRFAAAIGAHALAPARALIVANCGTATTIDAVTADGRFLGGMILPGLGLMATSLARNTAQLPQIAQDGKLPPALAGGFADNTDDAILSGCLAAQAGAIEHAYAQHGAAECIVSGGAARYIAPMLALPYRLVDNIVLVGLQASARSAQQSGIG